MADINLSITFDLGAKLDMMAVVNKQVFPLLHQAVNAIGKQTAYNWQEAVYGAKLWSGEKDAYAKSNEKARFRPLLRGVPSDFTEA